MTPTRVSDPLRPRARFSFSVLAAATLISACAAGSPARVAHAPASGPAHVAWRDFSPRAFETARDEHKLVLLSLQADWCHWCHVMNATTYRDPQVTALLDATFVSVRAEADVRPDLAERYAEWGWPATIVITPDGRELLALRGHQPAARFLPMLTEVAEAFRRGREVPRTLRAEVTADALVGELEPLRDLVCAQLDARWDDAQGGWGREQKYPFTGPVLHALATTDRPGREAWRARALLALERYAQLIDPVWGGMFQYSVGGVWTAPHFEKIAFVQANALEGFAAGYAATHEEKHRRAGAQVVRYLATLAHDAHGAFYASQDADFGAVHGDAFYAQDDAGRRAFGGMPRFDTRIYASENGRLTAALATFADATSDDGALALAEAAYARIRETHALPSGGYSHRDRAEDTDTTLFLADQVQMLRAALALHRATGRARYRDEALALARVVIARLTPQARAGDGGHHAFLAHEVDPHAVGVFADTRTPFVDNAQLARAFDTLAELTDDATFEELARGIVLALGDRNVLREQGRIVGEYLLAIDAVSRGPLHVTVVGAERDPVADALHRGARALDAPFAVLERALPNESRYGDPGRPAVFFCSDAACSMPSTEPAQLAEAFAQFLRDERAAR